MYGSKKAGTVQGSGCEMKKVMNYENFTEVLLDAGFSMGGGNSEGIYSIIDWDWDKEPPYDTPVKWHTGDKETDPWEWRMRVLDERNDTAYAKFFFRKSGYITKEWYPYFFACRRGSMDFMDMYLEGRISNEAKRIYTSIEEEGVMPLHELKKAAGFGKEDKSRFDRALVELQMNLFLTICGRRHKISAEGKPYGWDSTAFCKTEDFWDREVLKAASAVSSKEAEERIREQILRLNPLASDRNIHKFIYGRAGR